MSRPLAAVATWFQQYGPNHARTCKIGTPLNVQAHSMEQLKAKAKAWATLFTTGTSPATVYVYGDWIDTDGHFHSWRANEARWAKLGRKYLTVTDRGKTYRLTFRHPGKHSERDIVITF